MGAPGLAAVQNRVGGQIHSPLLLQRTPPFPQGRVLETHGERRNMNCGIRASQTVKKRCPADKTPKLLHGTFESASDPADIVLDSFTGSGTFFR